MSLDLSESKPVLGVDYYPEHWSAEQWATDAALMREAGLKVVRVAEFAWNKLEPQAGTYDWEWLDKAVATLANEGLLVIIGTPTSAPPPWMTFDYPEVLATNQQGQRLTAGGRHFYCPSSPYYRTQCNRLARDMAAHFKEHEAIIGWQVDNEFGNHGNCRCYCSKCEDRWHQWLTQRYHYDIERLNSKWGATFWGQQWMAFGQIPLPTVTGARYSPSIMSEYYRFASENGVQFFELQVSAIRESFTSEQAFITHNIFYGDDNVNFYELAKQVDFMAWDNYPHGMNAYSDVSFYHNYVWGLKQQNYWVMEQGLGNVNWTKFNPPVPPSQVRLWTLQNSLLGADATVYFSWQQSRFGQEQYHSAFLRHDGKPSRSFDTVRRISMEIEELPADLWKRPKASVAMLFSFDDWWGLQIEPHNEAFDYLAILKDIHASLGRRYIACDILPRGCDITELMRYKLVIAPAALFGDWEESDRWRRYVEVGNKLLLITRTGLKEKANSWVAQAQPQGVSEWLGLRVGETLSFAPYEQGNSPDPRLGSRPATRDEPLLMRDAPGKLYAARRLWAEMLEPESPDCEVLLRYVANNYTAPEHVGDFFAGGVALAGRELGRGGYAYYLGVLPTESTNRHQIGLYDYLWEDLFKNEAQPAAPGLARHEGLELLRVGTESQYLAMLNHTNQVINLRLDKTYRHVQSSDLLKEIAIAPFSIDFVAEL